MHSAERRPEHSAPDDRTTVGPYLTVWVARREGQVGPRMLRDNRRIVEEVLVPRLGRLRLCELTAQHVSELYADLARATSPTGAPRSVKAVHEAPHKALNDAVCDGLLTTNPCSEGVLPERDAPGPPAAWSTEELAAFLVGTADRPRAQLWIVAAGLDLPRRELLALTWDDIDLEARLLQPRWALREEERRIMRQPARSSRGTLPFGEAVAAALATQRRDQERWSARHGELWHHRGISCPRGRPAAPCIRRTSRAPFAMRSADWACPACRCTTCAAASPRRPLPRRTHPTPCASFEDRRSVMGLGSATIRRTLLCASLPSPRHARGTDAPRPLKVPISAAADRGVSWLNETAQKQRVILTRFGKPGAVVDSAERLDEFARAVSATRREVIEQLADLAQGRVCWGHPG